MKINHKSKREKKSKSLKNSKKTKLLWTQDLKLKLGFFLIWSGKFLQHYHIQFLYAANLFQTLKMLKIQWWLLTIKWKLLSDHYFIQIQINCSHYLLKWYPLPDSALRASFLFKIYYLSFGNRSTSFSLTLSLASYQKNSHKDDKFLESFCMKTLQGIMKMHLNFQWIYLTYLSHRLLHLKCKLLIIKGLKPRKKSNFSLFTDCFQLKKIKLLLLTKSETFYISSCLLIPTMKISMISMLLSNHQHSSKRNYKRKTSRKSNN